MGEYITHNENSIINKNEILNIEIIDNYSIEHEMHCYANLKKYKPYFLKFNFIDRNFSDWSFETKEELL